MKFIEKILFPTDFSVTSECAMHYAIEFAKRFDAELEIVHVLFDESQVVAFYLPQVTFQNLDKELEEGAKKQFDEFINRYPELSEISYTTKLLKGTPFLEIINEAKEYSADVIVIGGSNIYSMLNGLTYNFLERLYQFQHDGKSLIAGKLGVAVGVGSGRVAADTINKFFSKVGIRSLGTISTKGAVPCYSFGFGHTCSVSNVRSLVDENRKIDISSKPDLEKQTDIMKEARELGIKIRLQYFDHF